MTLAIELFDSKIHDRSLFDCDVASLNKYITKTASQDLKRKVATVFVLVDKPNNKIMAYYSLSAFTIQITEIDRSLAKKLPRYPLLPATMLGRLAVDLNYQGQSLGKFMLIDALKRSFLATQQVASVAVVVEAFNDKAISFYKKYGFIAFTSEPSRLYFPMIAIALMFRN